MYVSRVIDSFHCYLQGSVKRNVQNRALKYAVRKFLGLLLRKKLDERKMPHYLDTLCLETIHMSLRYFVLPLSSFICHEKSSSVDLMRLVETDVELILRGYTYVLLPFTALIMRLMQLRLQQSKLSGHHEQNFNLGRKRALLFTDCKNISLSISTIFESIFLEVLHQLLEN